jgi:CRISPR-associated endonuclease Csn1
VSGYTFGLDIGIASVGWALLDERRIVDLGVRCFEKAETAKEGDPLNLTRRQARLLRRRLSRRAWRLKKLARLLKREGLIPDARRFVEELARGGNGPATCHVVTNTWELRRQGLDRLLTPVEWARVIYHICKHRGFHWTSKAEEVKADSDAEGGRVKQGLKNTQALMVEKGYRSAAEMILAEFPTSQRNKRGQYHKALSRVLLGQELALLFATQRRLGNPHASERFQALILGNGDRRSGLFWQQKPALSGADLLKMLGTCTFEKSEYRAPKASFSAERHVWLTRLNNLRIIDDGRTRPLNEAERQAALALPYQTENFKYKTLKNALVKAGLWAADVRFAGMAYPSPEQLESGKATDPEDQTLVKLGAWHELRLAFKRAGQEALWRRISTPALEGQPELLDQIAWVLSVYKDGAEVTEQLRKLPLPEPETSVAILESISFDKFSALSLKALRRIVPLMEQGLRYDEAVARIPEYGHHSQIVKPDAAKHLYLPPFYQDKRKYAGKSDRIGSMVFREDANIPRNPVVLRALNQARKVVNALIRRYGSPTAVHIEMARDLSRPMDERNKVRKAQEEFRDRNAKAREDFERDFGYKPKSAVFEKWMLYREQHGQCAYSQQALDIQRVLDDPNYAQIDHALPYSRSYDDSKNNKVLVLTRENQNKGNRTPYEYLTSFPGGEDGERWRNFVAWVQQNKSYRMAKRNRLLRKNYGAEESRGFIDRNLNDTRYICRFFKNYVEEHLQLAPREDGNTNRRCVVVNGQLTAFLRAKWGLTKLREESDRHHALDAAVVAACTHGMVKALADHAKAKELAFLREGFPDPETGEILNPAAYAQAQRHFPEPWPHFRHELQSRLFTDDLDALRADMQRLGTYTEDDLKALRTVFVSRAVQRRGTPAIHESTLRSPKYITDQKSAVRIPLIKLTSAKLEEIVEAHGRNKPLVDALRQRLSEHGNDPTKAFALPFYKPSAEGKVAPLVTSVRIVTTQRTGIRLANAIAELGEMTGVNVYKLKRGYFVDPVYPAPAEVRLNNKPHPPDAEFQFSLTKNDFVEVQLGDVLCRGYFVMYESDGRMTLRAHDQPQPDKKYFRKGIAGAKLIRKLNVDVLGHIYPAPPEVRRGLA